MVCFELIEVFVIAPPRVLLLDLAGPLEILRRANLEQERVRFRITYAGPRSSVVSSVGLSVGPIGPLPDQLPQNAYVLVPGRVDDVLATATVPGCKDQAADEEIISWLSRSIRPDIRLVCICSGALFAARAGLLDGFECTTHHDLTSELARIAPCAQVLDNRLFVIDRQRLTSAGVTSGVDLMLHVISELTTPACALAIARFLVVYLRRAGADPQLSVWLEGRNHGHPLVHRAQDAILSDPSHAWSSRTLAQACATSERSLSRHFSEQAGMSVIDFVNRARIALARQILEDPRMDMEQVAERCGFRSSRQLRRAWRRLHDLPPGRMRREHRA
jgi:transcriptional regulator GlxA family with amidase domain